MREQVAQTTYSASEDRHQRRATEGELRAWGAFLRAGTTSAAALEAALAGTGISYSEYDVLFNVATGPKDGLRPTELIERVVITKSGLTRLVDRLVEHGYLERRPCESDRRGQLIVITAEGRRAFRYAAPNVVRAIGTFFGGQFTERDAAALRTACERIAAAAEAMTA